MDQRMLRKQLGPRSDSTKRQAWSGSKLFDIRMVFLEEFSEIVDFENKSVDEKNMQKLASMQRLDKIIVTKCITEMHYIF